ncbi:hypothetical protein ABZ895_11965 [Streptomyces californicus]|uniref:hypothetical protein n=1 Tax=Streptomyces californicus TaxID=67351 RepID=UPI0033EDE647
MTVNARRSSARRRFHTARGSIPTNDEAAGKEARRNLRELSDDGLIVRPESDQAVYRLA